MAETREARPRPSPTWTGWAGVVAAGAWSWAAVAGAATTTYTGPWAGGTIQPADTVVLADGASVTGTVAAHGTLAFAHSGLITIGNTLWGSGTLTLVNTGTLALSKVTIGSNASLFDMRAMVSRGTLLFGSGGGNDLAMGVYRSGSMSVSGGLVRNANATIASVPGNYYADPPSGISASVTVTGGTWATSGELVLGSTGTGALVVSGGLVSAGSAKLASIIGANWFGNPRGLVTVTGGTMAVSGDVVIAPSGLGVGRLTVGGSGLVSVNGTLSTGRSGVVTVDQGGTIQIGAGGTTGVLGANLQNNGTLVFNRSGSSSCTAVISGTGRVVKRGDGLLTLSGSNTATGTVSVEQGTLLLANAVTVAAAGVAPLAGGTVTLAPRIQARMGGLDPNAGGLVDVGNGLVTVGGGLSDASLVAALIAGRGDGSWNGSSGIVSSEARASVASNVSRSVGWLDNGDGSKSFAYAAPGDTNLDWQVDLLDVANFVSAGKFDASSPAAWGEGDFDYDGIVDILDVAEFLSNGLYDLGGYNGAAAATVTAVPEPVCPVMWLAAVAVTAAVRRRLQRPAVLATGLLRRPRRRRDRD